MTRERQVVPVASSLQPPVSSFWRRVRRAWHMWFRGLSREAAEDLIDGLDAGDRPVAARPLRRPSPDVHGGRRGRPLSLADPEALDSEFLAGGPVADRVVRRLAEELWPERHGE